MARRAAFLYDDRLADHVLSDTHPMRPVRLRYTHDLLDGYDAFSGSYSSLVAPRPASEDEIAWHHTAGYIDAVRAIGAGDWSVNPSAHNFGPGDNPPYEGMYDAAILSTGASVQAAEMLIAGDVDAAFNISGGLHHAMPNYAYGFCVFNDPVIAIKRLVAEGMRVAYVDIDCHHGDGVQHAFYDTNAVLTISLHESGVFLFPGTGSVQEIGAGLGKGYSVNVPLYPYTTDDVYLWAFREVVPGLLDSFQPDVLVTQLGIDSHYRDPITHMALTVQGFAEVVSELGARSPGKWLATGGGGYDLHAVARAWTLAYGVISEQTFADEIPSAYADTYDVVSLPDLEGPQIEDSVRDDARAFAEASVQTVHRLIFPPHGLRPV
ncbi:MAG: acetoin utilization protein AcuC [SAR202 cluster bacterium]|jgi:acetoin utilization protein AcuC|nr:acetoin utilization protein AcuC [SAR202 cluster bacterium]MDP6299837.1 acetoin utilization protein AcuC [SAR202 cluster bacterium]MDP7102572.1 acetoin utilization protein AcuC [SAR202 cluster bacterium]MDP7223902.1 acetoin utilization protein AcuC [SAR202 cluster bacterium]MDP7413242.1 acetoin utilization protein AcuC [SAR202 cluster bacterium]|tara:strand:+ start:272 stop:1405 length:1134 start_codon:yes stop_codon:yes gene_type:complete